MSDGRARAAVRCSAPCGTTRRCGRTSTSSAIVLGRLGRAARQGRRAVAAWSPRPPTSGDVAAAADPRGRGVSSPPSWRRRAPGSATRRTSRCRSPTPAASSRPRGCVTSSRGSSRARSGATTCEHRSIRRPWAPRLYAARLAGTPLGRSPRERLLAAVRSTDAVTRPSCSVSHHPWYEEVPLDGRRRARRARAARDFAPHPTVRLASHRVPRASTPAVDAHNHLGRWHAHLRSGRWSEADWRVKDVPALVGVMDECNVATVVNLDGELARRARGQPRPVRPGVPRPVRQLRPGRLGRDGREGLARAGRRLGRRLRGTRRGRAQALEGHRPSAARRGGRAVSSSTTPAWRGCGRPSPTPTCRSPSTRPTRRRSSSRWTGTTNGSRSCSRHPDWQFMGPQFPRWPGSSTRWRPPSAANPRVTFVAAHVGCYAEDLDWVDRMLGDLPELQRRHRGADRRARPAATPHQAAHRGLPRQGRPGHRRLAAHREDYEIYFRFLETADEYFPYDAEEPPGQRPVASLGPRPVARARRRGRSGTTHDVSSQPCTVSPSPRQPQENIVIRTHS